ncbi:MAG: ACP S-malonyltransferase [Pyrinomonadaceae bacterium]|nr:ACP S-malonyltransferase [Pyrinomonadaceae bacterium]
MSIAYIFPGQGAQYAGMGRELANNFFVARRVYEEADDALGFALSQLCFEGSAEKLQLTENTQPAILTTSIAAHRVLKSEGFAPPDYVAGHSLGEYSALVAANSLSLAQAVQTVRARGRYMQEAVPIGVGAMAAILGADLEVIREACNEAAQGEVCSPANVNSPSQVVIAGHSGAVDRAIDLLKMRGARRALKLKVSAPFHCALMQPAQDTLAFDLEQLEFANLEVPLVTNTDAMPIHHGTQAREALIRQVSSPVQWRASLDLLSREGVTTFVEVGPGKVLSGLVKQTIPAARCLNVEDMSSLNATGAALKAMGDEQKVFGD